jgi:hypothetical protein
MKHICNINMLFLKNNDIGFSIIYFLRIYSNCNNPVYGVYISQIIPCTRDCILYIDFLRRHRYLSTKLVNQRFLEDLIFQSVFLIYQHLADKFLSHACWWLYMVLAIIFFCKDDHCFLILSSDSLLYYLTFTSWLRPSGLLWRISIIHMTSFTTQWINTLCCKLTIVLQFSPQLYCTPN